MSCSILKALQSLVRTQPAALALAVLFAVTCACVPAHAGLVAYPYQMVTSSEHVLSPTPVLYTQKHDEGCAPNAAAIALGYMSDQLIPGYADRRFWSIFGQGISRSTAENATIDNLIASAGHRNDYTFPWDPRPFYSLNPDMSSNPGWTYGNPAAGGCHPHDSIADFMATSVSASPYLCQAMDTNISVGLPTTNMVYQGITNYLKWRKPHVGTYTFAYPGGYGYTSSNPNWVDIYKAAIDANTPVVMLVRTANDLLLSPDHVVVGIGYGTAKNYQTGEEKLAYEIIDPLDNLVKWYYWHRTGTYDGSGLLDSMYTYGVAGFAPLTLGLGPTFTDVPMDYWAWQQIEACAFAKIVAGYPDGSYHPIENVTRAQIAVFLARAAAGGDQNVTYTGGQIYYDVPSSHWAFKYIGYCDNHDIIPRGWYAGYMQRFYPDSTGSQYLPNRGDMAVFIASALCGGYTHIPDYTGSQTFPDLPHGSKYYDGVEYCYTHSIVNGYPDGKYHAEYTITRDQLAVFLQRAWPVLISTNDNL